MFHIDIQLNAVPIPDVNDDLWVLFVDANDPSNLSYLWRTDPEYKNVFDVIGNKCVRNGNRTVTCVHDVLLIPPKKHFFIFEDDGSTVKNIETKEVIFDKSVIKRFHYTTLTIFMIDDYFHVYHRGEKYCKLQYDVDTVVDVLICAGIIFILTKDGKIDQIITTKTKNPVTVTAFALEDVYAFAYLYEDAFIANTTDGKTWLCNAYLSSFTEIPFLDMKPCENWCLFKNANKNFR